jgi:hypothetical protein
VGQARINVVTGGHETIPLEGESFIVIKRIVVAAFVTAVTAVGIAAPADAAQHHAGSVSTQAIDWD